MIAPTRVKHFLLAFAGGICLSDALVAAPPPQVVRTIAREDEAAPGAVAGAVFREFGNAILYDDGTTSFRARLRGPGTSENSSWGVWSETTGALKLVARAGQTAPGMSTVYSDNISTPRSLGGGASLFWADVGIGSVWREQNGAIGLVATVNMPAPGTGGANFRIVWGAAPANETGQYAFMADLAGPGVDGSNMHGMWRGATQGIELVARSGSPAPQTESGTTFAPLNTDMLSQEPALTASGKLLFTSRLAGPSVTFARSEAIWIHDGAGLHQILRSGEQAPGSPAGAYLSGFDAVANDGGDVALAAKVIHGNDFLPWGVFSVRHGAVAKIAQIGDDVPGAAPGSKFTGGRTPIISDNGDIAFLAQYRTPNDELIGGIWADRGAGLEMVALEGQLAPGGVAGSEFSGFDELVFNQAGQIAFLARAGLKAGVWATDRSDVLQKVAVVGDVLEYRPGQSGIISNIPSDAIRGFDSYEGMGKSINADGMLAFRAFIDGVDGLFVSSAVAIPEPSAATISGIACMLCSRRRREQGSAGWKATPRV